MRQADSFPSEGAARSDTLSASHPKWMQVAAALRSDIRALVQSGERRLPTEADLARRFSVSVMTVRQALGALEAEGLVVRRRRHGTFLTDHAVRSRRIHMLGRVADVFEQQQSDEIRVLSAQWVEVPDHLEGRFADARRVLRLERMRSIDGEPCNHAVNYMREDVAAQVDLELLRRYPVSQVISEHTDFTIAEMVQELCAQTADPDIAARLRIQPLDPVMELVGTSYDAAGRMLDIARILYRGDRFRFVNRVHN